MSQQARSSHETNQKLTDQRKTQIIKREKAKPKTWSWGLLVDDWWSRWSRMYSHTSQQAQSSHETNQNLADQRKTQIIEREKAKAIRDSYDEICFDWYVINVALQPLHEGRQSSTHEHENQSLSRTLISTSRTHARTRTKTISKRVKRWAAAPLLYL